MKENIMKSDLVKSKNKKALFIIGGVFVLTALILILTKKKVKANVVAPKGSNNTQSVATNTDLSIDTELSNDVLAKIQPIEANQLMEIPTNDQIFGTIDTYTSQKQTLDESLLSEKDKRKIEHERKKQERIAARKAAHPEGNIFGLEKA